jgi:Protein of unknown function (DUF3024)
VPAPPETDVARIRRYCRARVPVRLRHQVRVEAAVRGNSVTLFDCRPPWHPNLTEWSKVRVAQLRYSASTYQWSLYWADRNGRWHPYDDLDSGPVDKVLNEIEADPTCIFWG